MDLNDLQPGTRVRFTVPIPIQDDFDGIPVGAEGVVVDRIRYFGDLADTPIGNDERAIQLDEPLRCLAEWSNCVMISADELAWGNEDGVITHSHFVLQTISAV